MPEEIFNPNPQPRWFNCPLTHAAHLRGLRDHLAGTLPQAPSGGDGIVYVGGGPYWSGIVVGCRLLRHFGCTLPIQVWYRGTCEPVDAADVEGLGVELIDADALSEKLDDNRVPTGDPKTGGWEAKGYALTHCGFTRILYLDADAYCVADPTPLFEASKGAALTFWEDFPNMAANVKWHAVLPEGAATAPPPIQGGQLLIDRRLCEPTLQLMHWMCQYSDFYFKQMFGDQDAWRVALAATGAPVRNLGPAPWQQTAFVCPSPGSGSPLIVHRCQGKLFKPADIPTGKAQYSNPKYDLPHEALVFGIFAEILNRVPPDAAVFDEHYRRGLWGGGSGGGSTPAEARPYIETVNALAGFAGWKSAVDVGCGDGRVARELNFSDYRGFDGSAEAVRLFAAHAPGKRAEVFDCYNRLEELPDADVLLCRDVLHHWPSAMVTDWLTRVRESKKWKAVILCFDRHQIANGADTYTGGYRGLNPSMMPLKPFGLKVLNEHLHKVLVSLSA